MSSKGCKGFYGCIKHTIAAKTIKNINIEPSHKTTPSLQTKTTGVTLAAIDRCA
jgi:hypothetical protein